MASESSYVVDVHQHHLEVDNGGYHRGFSDYSDPLIEVCSVTISPSEVEVEAYESFLIYGQIYVVGPGRKKIHIYNRPEHHPQTITSDGPRTLLLTGPEKGVIKMDGQHKMFINLSVQGLTLAQKKKPTRHKALTRGAAQKLIEGQTDVLFADGFLCFEEPDEVGYHDENKSVTLKGNLGAVEVYYTYMPFARVARLSVTFTQDSHVSATSSSPDAHISGKITAHCIGSHPRSSVVLFDDNHAQVQYGVPINLCRSLVCVPSYSSLSVKLVNIDFDFVGEHKKDNFSLDFECDISRFTDSYTQNTSIENVHVTVKVTWFTTAALEIFLKGVSKWSFLPRVIDGDEIQVLSVFVGTGDDKLVDIWGRVVVDHWDGPCYIFYEDMDHRRKWVSGKGSTLVGVNSYPGVTSYPGLTTYPGNSFSMFVDLKGDMTRSGPVDINNYFGIYEYDYLHRPGKWFNTPLCQVLLGEQGFVAVHFIVFYNAEKAAVKISVISRDSNASLPSGYVYGTLVAQYSNYKYLTNYQRKYWTIDLFQVKEKDARELSENGEISLLRDVWDSCCTI